MITRSRDRSQNAKNINRRQTVFETSTNRESSRFEHVKAKATILHNENVVSKMQNVLHRADSALERERGRRREQASEQASEQTSERASRQASERASERVSREENVISTRERESERSRKRERGQEQAVMSKET